MCNHQANYNLITRNTLFPPEVDSVRAGAGPQSEVVFVVWFVPRLTEQVPPLGSVTGSVITNHLGNRPADSLRDLLTTHTISQSVICCAAHLGDWLALHHGGVLVLSLPHRLCLRPAGRAAHHRQGGHGGRGWAVTSSSVLRQSHANQCRQHSDLSVLVLLERKYLIEENLKHREGNPCCYCC